MSDRGVPRPPFQRLRRTLLVLLVLTAGGVAGLYVLGRSARPAIEEETAGTGPGAARGRSKGADATREAVLWSEGFEYEQRIGERSAFQLRGDRFATDREGIVTLRGVGLELTRENGDSYRIQSRRAAYDPKDQSARLAGDVHLTGARDLRLEAEKLDLVRGGRTVVSRGAVHFGLGAAYSGDASALRFDFERDRFQLRGGVHVSGAGPPGRGPVALHAEQVVFERPQHLLHATGRARLSAGRSRLRAHRIDVALDSEDREAQRALAVGGVAGQLLSPGASDADRFPDDAGETGDESAVENAAAGTPGPGERLHFAGATLRVGLAGEPRQASEIDLEGAEAAPAQLTFRAPEGGAVRTLTAPHVVATLDSGKLQAATATGGIRLDERGAGTAERVATSNRAEASFDAAGELASLRLLDEVTLEQAATRAQASRADVDAATGRVVLTGGRERVRVTTDRGELRAPRVEFERTGSKLHARDGVLAVLRPQRSAIGPVPADRSPDTPIRVESREADADDVQRSWEFRGDVRAVEGDDLLFADRLSGTEQPATLSASGSVRTVTRQAGGAGKSVTTTVSADGLAYDRTAARIEYSGSVRVRQEEREMTGDDLVIELDDQQRARRMTATGTVRIDDRAAGRSVTGKSAVHDLEARTILVEGDPVVLTEKGGGTVRGHRLLYDLGAGSARMLPDQEVTP